MIAILQVDSGHHILLVQVKTPSTVSLSCCGHRISTGLKMDLSPRRTFVALLLISLTGTVSRFCSFVIDLSAPSQQTQKQQNPFKLRFQLSERSHAFKQVSLLIHVQFVRSLWDFWSRSSATCMAYGTGMRPFNYF